MYWGHEEIKGLQKKTVKDFWQWTYSDLMIGNNQHDMGLFFVANALELTKMPRIDWGGVDLRYRNKKIAVKTSAYIQSWKQKKPKRVLFDIAPKKGIDAKTESSLTFRNREAEIYIFCLLTEKVVSKIDVLNLDQWKFYIVRTSVLDEGYKDKKKIGLRPLNQLVTPVSYDKIKPILDDLIDYELTEKLTL